MSGPFLDPCFLLMKTYFRDICMHVVLFGSPIGLLTLTVYWQQEYIRDKSAHNCLSFCGKFVF